MVEWKEVKMINTETFVELSTLKFFWRNYFERNAVTFKINNVAV